MLSKSFHLFILSILCACLSCTQTSIKPQWPEIKTQTKPWTRWWWQGSAVSKEGITAELEAYKKAGLGGVEITPIYGVYGEEDQFIDYLSPQWVDMLIYTLEEADRLGLGVDMATGTGWPFGGPWVGADDACKNMVYKTYMLKGGEQLKEPVAFLQESMARTVGLNIPRVTEEHPEFKPQNIGIEDIQEPISANKNLQSLALDQVRFKKNLPLQALVAYSESGDKIDITSKVDRKGNLNWIAPKGNWTLYAVFQGWHGKMVERAAPGGEGNVIDHFSATALQHYLSKFDSALEGRNIQSLRAFFNDSYEVDDARGSADFTPLLFKEFEKRNGYSLLDFLPALFGNDTEENNERVLCDYRQTISDLILENFTHVWKKWAHDKGAVVRNQAHGSPANILDLYEVVDIPEMEGTDVLRIKMASSAANVSGKPLISSESATWLNEHFTSNLGDIKSALDRYMFSGINHIFYHGTCYSPPSEPWPGRLFYAAVHVNPRNSLWSDFGHLNNYVSRCQSFLQNSKADNDILLYLPIYDRFSTPGRELLEHFDGIDRQFEGTAFKNGAEFMLKNGYAFDYVSDKQILKSKQENDTLKTGGGAYKTIVIPGCKYIPLATFEKLVSLAENGANIIMYNGLPQNVAGMSDVEAKKTSFAALISKVNVAAKPEGNYSIAKLGNGSILIGTDLDQLLSKAQVKRESMVDSNLQYVRKKSPRGTLYFIANRGDKKIDGWVSITAAASSAFIFDPMSGKSGKAHFRKADEGSQIYLQLDPMESVIVEAYPSTVSGEYYPVFQNVSDGVALKGKWNIHFISGGPEIPEDIAIEKLESWTNAGDQRNQNFSGTAQYSLQFKRPEMKAGHWILDLGEVAETAEVLLNGKVLDTLIGPSFKVVIPNDLMKEENQLTINVSNLMANRIAYLDKNNVFWKKFYNVNFPPRLPENRKNGIFDASNWEPRPSGVLGPVTLFAVEEKKFD